MADNRIKAFLSTLARVSKGEWTPQTGLADGTPFSAPWLQKLAMDGRMFVANAGTGTAPITGAGAYVNTTPDLDMSVPAGRVVVPIYLTVQFETYGTSLLNEIVAAIGWGGVIAPTSATAVVPVATNPAKSQGSSATIVSDGTGATYMTSNVYEFWRHGQAFSITKTSASATVASQDSVRFEWSAMASGVWPVMYNPSGISRFNLFPCSQAPTEFITLVYVEPDPAIFLA